MGVGGSDGKDEDWIDGGSVGSSVGVRVGSGVGCIDGGSVGKPLGAKVGSPLGAGDGSSVGLVGTIVGAHEYSSAQQRAWYNVASSFREQMDTESAFVLPIWTRKKLLFRKSSPHGVRLQIIVVSKLHPDPFVSSFKSSSSVQSLAPTPSQKSRASVHETGPLQPTPWPKSLLPPHTPSSPRRMFPSSPSSVHVDAEHVA